MIVVVVVVVVTRLQERGTEGGRCERHDDSNKMKTTTTKSPIPLGDTRARCRGSQHRLSLSLRVCLCVFERMRYRTV